jgi:hypothetical protein
MKQIRIIAAIALLLAKVRLQMQITKLFLAQLQVVKQLGYKEVVVYK